MINNIQPNSIVKEDFDNAMRNFCKKVTFNSHEYYKNTKMSYRPVYKPAGGRKYIKVKSFETNTVDHNGNKVVDTKGRIFCFVHHQKQFSNNHLNEYFLNLLNQLCYQFYNFQTL